MLMKQVLALSDVVVSESSFVSRSLLCSHVMAFRLSVDDATKPLTGDRGGQRLRCARRWMDHWGQKGGPARRRLLRNPLAIHTSAARPTRGRRGELDAEVSETGDPLGHGDVVGASRWPLSPWTPARILFSHRVAVDGELSVDRGHLGLGIVAHPFGQFGSGLHYGPSVRDA